ncbi:hydrogenase maturation protease [Streptomyces sp. NPDC059740]|uniref:hydrogenase maturation protease n=1 Tax=Streptomyces sp. NPDC059740 TaxID=3346926 RepID=UPI00365A5EEE
MTETTGAAVIGIGNEFRRDDGVGLAVAAEVRERAVARPLPPGTTVHASDGDPGRLIRLWEHADLAVLVDACFPPSPRPGRIHRWCRLLDFLPHAVAGTHSSTHGWGVARTVRLAHTLGRCPRHLLVYGVEGAERALGTGLTPAVAAAVGPLVERIEGDLARYALAGANGPAAWVSRADHRRASSVPGLPAGHAGRTPVVRPDDLAP